MAAAAPPPSAKYLVSLRNILGLIAESALACLPCCLALATELFEHPLRAGSRPSGRGDDSARARETTRALVERSSQKDEGRGGAILLAMAALNPKSAEPTRRSEHEADRRATREILACAAAATAQGRRG